MNKCDYNKLRNLGFLSAAESILKMVMPGSENGILNDADLRIVIKYIKRIKQVLLNSINAIGSTPQAKLVSNVGAGGVDFQMEHRFHVRPVPGGNFAVYHYTENGTERLIEPEKYGMEPSELRRIDSSGVNKLIVLFAEKHGFNPDKCYTFYY